MFIHKAYASLGNIAKIPTPAPISPYLQNIRITNHPLQPWIILNLYMPSHEEDLHLIPDILDTITQTITQHPNHTIILITPLSYVVTLIVTLHSLVDIMIMNSHLPKNKIELGEILPTTFN
jgi:hypothetical protein